MPVTGTDLDHVALAAHSFDPLWDRLVGDLGAAWVGGGDGPGGFTSAQVRFAGGMKVEGLVPFQPENNDFLERFLFRNGPGPHHLTFKVPDLEAAMDRARAAGIEPVGVDLRDPGWMEAFLHPKAAHGIVLQLAQSAGEWEEPPPPDLPAPRVAAPAELVHVAHAVADLDGALGVLKGVLDGVAVDAGAGGGVGWVDLRWPGPGRVRVLAGGPAATWVGDRPGRLHHLALRLDDPAGVPGAVDRGGWWEVAPEAALGTRLVLVATGDPVPLGL